MATVSGTRLPRMVIEACHSIAHDLFGSYRPEMHYMRGPGPKCREKIRRSEAARQAHPHPDMAHAQA